MILLLDVGNSRVKWAVHDGKRLRVPQAAQHQGVPSHALATLELPVTDAVWVANVTGPQHEEAIAHSIDLQCGLRAQFARVRRSWRGLRVAYAQPERLGIDRWLSMVALWTELERPFGVANAGTALTYDEVMKAGRHRGGLIGPGLTTAWNAVRGATRFAMDEAPPPYGDGLGTDTESCVRQGALHACAGLVTHASRDLLGAKVITGGDAETLRPHLGKGWLMRPHLVLEGLAIYARHESS